MVNIPTTSRQFYNNVGKVNTLKAYADALQPAANSYQEQLKQEQKIRIDANATKGRAEADEFVRQLQLQYQRTPNSDEYKQAMKEGLNEIWKKYGADIDPLMQGVWQQTVNKLNVGYDEASNQWAFKQRQENAKFDMAEGMNVNYSLAYTHGNNDNIAGAVADLDLSYNQLKENATAALGEVEAAKLLKDYKKQYIQNFIDGQLQSNPEAAIQSLDNKEIAQVFENTKDVDDMKKYAFSKLETVKKQNKYKNILAGIQQGNGLLNKSMEQNLSLEEINRLMPEGASEDYKNYIYSLNGYKKQGSGKGGSGKLGDDEKVIEAADIYEQLSMLLANKDKATVEDFNQVQNNVYKALNNKSLTKAEGQKIINQIMEPMADAWQNNLKDLNEGGFWKRGDPVGANAVIDSLENEGILKKVKSSDKKTKEALQAANSQIKVKAYQYFYDELNKAIQESGGRYNSIADVIDDNDRAQKRAILQKAQDAALHDMASDQFSYLANYKEEQQPNKVLKSGGMTANTNNVNNAKLGAPVKQNLYIKTAYDPQTGKYGLVRNDGTIEEVSYERYKQFGGLK